MPDLDKKLEDIQKTINSESSKEEVLQAIDKTVYTLMNTDELDPVTKLYLILDFLEDLTEE